MAMLLPVAPLIRLCPGCHRYPLRPVYGGLGKMGQCTACGWTGPLRHEDDEPVANAGEDETPESD
jgi:hypothetical protein